MMPASTDTETCVSSAAATVSRFSLKLERTPCIFSF